MEVLGGRPEAPGPIEVSSPALFEGYTPTESPALETAGAAEATSPGGAPGRRWHRTGDLGFVEHDELFVVGRADDVICVAGRNLHATDLESTVAASGLVRPGAVTATAHPAGGYLLIAEVKTDRGLADIASALRRDLAAHHGVRPTEITLCPPGTLPRTTSGKPRRPIAADLHRQGRLDTLHQERWTGQ